MAILFSSSLYVLTAYQRSIQHRDHEIGYCIVELRLGKAYEQPSLNKQDVYYFEPKTRSEVHARFFQFDLKIIWLMDIYSL